MISIRLKKNSSQKNLTFSIIVIDSTKSAKSNKFKEKIGFYQPLVDNWSNKYLFIDMDKLLYWLNSGATLNSSLYVLIRPLLSEFVKNKSI